MISIICTNCKNALEMDDAFAGGVCRCQYCGTIQTVPSHLKRRAASPVSTEPAHALPGSKTLYARTPPGTGLEYSGAVESEESTAAVAPPVRTAKRQPSSAKAAENTVTPSEPARRRALLVPALVGGGVLAAGLIALVLWLVLRGHGASAGAGSGEEVVGPSIAGIRLTVPSVVYVLDRGNATDTYFDGLKAAVYRSMSLIGSDKKFAVILTDNGTDDFAYPRSGLRDNTPQELDNLRQALQDVVATGNSHFAAALKGAVDRHPAAIVVATGKFSMDEEDIAALRDVQKHGIPIDTLALGDTPNPALEEASTATGGQYKQVSNRELRNFAE